MMTYPRVSIVILNWNGLQDTIECLESIRKLTYPDYEIIVIDNSSTDDSCLVLKRDFPYVRLIENQENLGSGANNAGIRAAQGKYVLLLNNDVVVDPALLDRLVSVLESDPTIGAAGPLMYYYRDPKRIWHVGGKFLWKTGRIRIIGLNEVDEGQYRGIQDVDYVADCALLASQELLEKIGYDASYFLYFDDADLCARIGKAGFRTVCVPGAKIWHKVSASTGKRPGLFQYYAARNRMLFMKKNRTRSQFLGFLLYFFLTKFPLSSVSLLLYHRDFEGFKRFCRAVKDGLLQA